MLKLYCDLCGKEIYPRDNEILAEVDIQEQKYHGDNEFVVDVDCYRARKILCKQCRKELQRFLNVAVDRLDF